MLINKNFLGLEDRYCLIEKFLLSHVGTHMSCKYWHMHLLESFKGTDSSRETLLQPTRNPGLKKCVISTESYVYNEMNRLFRMKVPVKNYSNVHWFRQVKNTELTRSCIMSSSWSWRYSLIFSVNCRKRKTYWVRECTTVCLCVCIHWQGLARQHSSNSHYVFWNKQYVFQTKLWIQLAVFIAGRAELEETG